MFRRRRPLMRAAMVGGAGYYAGKKIQEGRQEDAPQDEPQQAAAPSAGGMSDDVIDQLGKLGQLHEQGVLTDDEFATQKQKLLEST